MAKLQDKFKLRPKEQYIALEDLDFSWDLPQIKVVNRMWNEGKNLSCIADDMGREADEVALLLMDQARKGKIQYREGGVYGVQ